MSLLRPKLAKQEGQKYLCGVESSLEYWDSTVDKELRAEACDEIDGANNDDPEEEATEARGSMPISANPSLP